MNETEPTIQLNSSKKKDDISVPKHISKFDLTVKVAVRTIVWVNRVRRLCEWLIELGIL